MHCNNYKASSELNLLNYFLVLASHYLYLEIKKLQLEQKIPSPSVSHSKVLCSFSCFLTEYGKRLMICVLIYEAYMSLRELRSDFMATVADNSHFNGTELQLKERLLGALVTVIAKCSEKMPTPSGTTN